MAKKFENEGDKVGAVLVVGAGIGGIQASLDLAEAGLKVHLVDKSPAIGGTMAQLDKTFPTNDCAMCILSPKLVECGRHLNIEVMTYAELESVEGEPGNFSARVRQKPRYVVVDECTGCGDCAEVCPIIRPDQFNTDLSERRAVYRLYPQAIPNAYVIEKRGVAPCRDVCPTGQRAQGYIALIREGRFADAYRTIKEDNPFPAVCGRVCNHVCETACSRGRVDDPVSIMRLKRFVTDWAFEHPDEVTEAFRPKIDSEAQAPEPTGKKVAIVGSGPAGLTVAQDLKLRGHAVTIFEALPVAGGMMRVGIPAYRLPYDLLQREIDEIVDLGVELKLNTRVDDVVALKDEYDAVFTGIGAHAGIDLPITGTDLPQSLSAIDFLRDASMGRYPDLAGKKVVVLGGGDVAMDAACTALRIGAIQADENGGVPSEVRVAYRRTEAEMPAQADEVRQAKEDGVIFDWLVSPVEVMAGEEGGVCGLNCCRMELGEPDESGRRRPVPIDGSEFAMEADVVISAIGARPNLTCVPESIDRTPDGRLIAVDENTMMTGVDGIFAAGDAVTGIAFVVDAIGAGHKAARAMDAYLRGEPMPSPKPQWPVAELTEEDIAAKRAAGQIVEIPRTCTWEVPPDERIHSLCEVCGPMTEEEAIAEATRCLQCGVCSECLQCAYACQKRCIDHDMREEIVELNVGAVVLVPGLETMPGDIRPELGYGRLPNVVTSIEFERMLSASGPWGGVIQRPSDGKHPRRVAFIQCVGSRDVSCGQGYCSSVCCMYATKEAIIAKEHDPDVEPTIFYMDVRSFGKGFEQYIERAEQEYGVRYVRSMVSTVTDVPGTGNLRVRYATPDGKNVEGEFDLVVLSVGLQPPEGTRELAERLGIETNEFGFVECPMLQPVRTTRPDGSVIDGIFVAGAFSEPKDIPETVIEASCAAAQASALLADARGTLTEERVWPEERDVSDEPPRVGVFICHCGINIGSVVDVPEVVEFVASLPDVAYAEQNLYTCSQDTQQRIRECIEEYRLNRVVVASCTPRTHEPLFQETIRAAGLNPHLFQMANIREQDSWVHRGDPQVATEKAKDLVRMAVAKTRQLCPIDRGISEVNHRALVIGGGLAGMTAALSVAEQGFGVTLVERENELGGNLKHIYTALPGEDGDPQALLQRTIEAVSANPRITVLTGAEVVDMGGYVGQYRSTVKLADGRLEEIQHGTVIVATGARQVEPQEYLYGEHARVVTQRELEEMLVSDLQSPISDLQSVVMIQCVGSRDEKHPYCSRVCCTEAIKNALAIKERSPRTDVYILYRDIRTFGFKERYYREARQKGVVFLQYDKDQKPEVKVADNQLRVDVVVQPEGERFTLDTDLVVLSAGIEPNVDNDALAQRLKVPLAEDGFFLEAHVKLRPLDFAADGVYLCGMAHSPRFLDETIAQAHGAAVHAVSLLARDELDATPIVASVDPLLCTACGLCVDICPYDARTLEPGAASAEVIEVLCQGCGACIVACPNKASQQKGFGIGQVYEMLDAMIVGG
jgi:heterodisulfide reductase subunit A-like polyferredoxin